MSLREARIKSGLSMDELGEKAGVSGAAICRYEHGDRVPKVKIAKKLGKILGIEWYKLIDNEEKKRA